MKQFLLILVLIVVGAVATLWLAPQTGNAVALKISEFSIDIETTLPIALGTVVLGIVALTILLRVFGWLLGILAQGIESIGRAVTGGNRGRGSVDSRMRELMGQPVFTTSRLLLALAAVAIGAVASIWIFKEIKYDTPVQFVFLDQTYDTNIAVFAAAAVLGYIAVLLVLRVLAWLLDLPGSFQRSSVAKLQTRDQVAILDGFLAIAARDGQAARRYFKKVSKETEGTPIHLLLGAEIAKLEGNNAALLEHSHAMMSNADSELAGLHLLLDAARNDGNAALAVSYGEQIQRRQTGDRWLLGTMVELYLQAGAWTKLKDSARKAAAARVIDNTRATRLGVLADYFLGAIAASQGRLDEAEKRLKQALNQDANFVPAAAKLIDIAMRKDDSKQAIALLIKSWGRTPHPELADRFLQIYNNLSPRMQLDRAQRLTRKNPRHPESAAFVARVALAAEAPSNARRVLSEALKRHNTVRLCQLMLDAQVAGGAETETIEYWAQRCAEAVPDSIPSLDSYLVDGAPSTSSTPVESSMTVTATPSTVAVGGTQFAALPAPGRTS